MIDQLFAFGNLHLFLILGEIFFACGIAQYLQTRAELAKQKKFYEGFEQGLKACQCGPQATPSAKES